MFPDLERYYFAFFSNRFHSFLLSLNFWWRIARTIKVTRASWEPTFRRGVTVDKNWDRLLSLNLRDEQQVFKKVATRDLSVQLPSILCPITIIWNSLLRFSGRLEEDWAECSLSIDLDRDLDFFIGFFECGTALLILFFIDFDSGIIIISSSSSSLLIANAKSEGA